LEDKIKITVVGSGYVGMSLAVLLAQNNDVVVHDIDSASVDKINENLSTIADKEIEDFLATKELSLSATLDKEQAYKDASFVVVATPTNYDPESNYFNTSSIDEVVSDVIRLNPDAFLIIKSTVPLGYTKLLQERHSTDHIIFSPEFLREGKALRDNLYPSRIIVGSHHEAGKVFSNLLKKGAISENIETLFISSDEAEAVKLFANAYLAMRVSFFNELDSFALVHNLDAESIINGICLDERIGKGYNNPSFGYGGYCLPKDTKQLLANYNEVPQKLIQAIVSSNSTRKDFITKEILKLKPKTIGLYRLVMKEGSDNFRFSAIQGIMNRIKSKNIDIIIYEPKLNSNEFFEYPVISDIAEFKTNSDVIIANRMDDNIRDEESKCFSRDIFGEN
jgi:UDPglucose 6-dehydrogenase